MEEAEASVRKAYSGDDFTGTATYRGEDTTDCDCGLEPSRRSQRCFPCPDEQENQLGGNQLDKVVHSEGDGTSALSPESELQNTAKDAASSSLVDKIDIENKARQIVNKGYRQRTNTNKNTNTNTDITNIINRNTQVNTR